jgi:hypothetical protein
VGFLEKHHEYEQEFIGNPHLAVCLKLATGANNDE